MTTGVVVVLRHFYFLRLVLQIKVAPIDYSGHSTLLCYGLFPILVNLVCEYRNFLDALCTVAAPCTETSASVLLQSRGLQNVLYLFNRTLITEMYQLKVQMLGRPGCDGSVSLKKIGNFSAEQISRK